MKTNIKMVELTEVVFVNGSKPSNINLVVYTVEVYNLKPSLMK